MTGPLLATRLTAADNTSKPAADKSEPKGGTGPGGDWPHTTRLLPWLIAGFIAMLFLVPVGAVQLPVHLPFDSTVDRLAMLVLVLAWLLSLGLVPVGPSRRRSPVNLAILVFLLIATVSVLLDFTALSRVEEVGLAVKKLSLLFCYAALYLVVVTSVRKREIPRFLALIVALASITALGTVLEYRTHTNYFYEWVRQIPLLQVGAEPPNPPYGRPSIVGPTGHGIADATILAMVVPMAVILLQQSDTRARRILYGIALALLVAGGVATVRKTSLLLPASALLILVLYRPRPMLRLLPFGLVLVAMVHIIAPGAVGGLRYQLAGGSQRSTEGRTVDYAALKPDVLSRPLIGRGYGTYDPKIQLEKQHPVERHRTLDNEVLLLLIETGIVGVLAYLAIPLLGMLSLHRPARSRDPARAGPAIALLAAIVAFTIANLLFDSLSFCQPPYLFSILLGFAVIIAAPRQLEPKR